MYGYGYHAENAAEKTLQIVVIIRSVQTRGIVGKKGVYKECL